ncbi:MAG: acyltransferase [Acidobacteria bacterium]|nr:acyltransferase [Acidobacteriota bacterium]
MPKGRLGSIDFLRGVASLAVVVYHVFAMGLFNAAFDPARSLVETLYKIPISFGYTGVYLFFVISGFCIHLRWAKARAFNKTDFSLNFAAFWRRRMIRLYPAYLATLAVGLGIAYYKGVLDFTPFFYWDLVSHLLMLHNFDARTVYSIDSVLWTLAIEEQLYLAYFLLVWLRDKIGWKRTLAICLGVRVGWFAAAYVFSTFFGVNLPVTESSMANWIVWALGAVAVEAALKIIELPKWTSYLSIGVPVLLLTAGLEYLDFYAGRTGLLHKFTWLVAQPLWGIGFFIVINRFVDSEINWFKWKSLRYVDRNLGIKMFAGIGIFSYSLYLIHEYVLEFVKSQTILTVLICVAAAWLFYLAFEKPFIRILEKK